MNKKSHIFAHLVNDETCKVFTPENSFEIIDFTSSHYD